MVKDFVTYEQALELSNYGFNDRCFGWYYKSISFSIEYLNLEYNHNFTTQESLELFDYRRGDLPCPTYSQAFRWLREKHGLEHQITYAGAKGRYNAFTDDWIYDSEGKLKEFTYEEAESACLDNLLKKLKIKFYETIKS